MGTKAMGVTAVLEPVSGVGLGVGDGQTALRVPVLGAGEGLEARAHTPGKWKAGPGRNSGYRPNSLQLLLATQDSMLHLEWVCPLPLRPKSPLCLFSRPPHTQAQLYAHRRH